MSSINLSYDKLSSGMRVSFVVRDGGISVPFVTSEAWEGKPFNVLNEEEGTNIEKWPETYKNLVIVQNLLTHAIREAVEEEHRVYAPRSEWVRRKDLADLKQKHDLMKKQLFGLLYGGTQPATAEAADNDVELSWDDLSQEEKAAALVRTLGDGTVGTVDGGDAGLDKPITEALTDEQFDAVEEAKRRG